MAMLVAPLLFSVPCAPFFDRAVCTDASGGPCGGLAVVAAKHCGKIAESIPFHLFHCGVGEPQALEGILALVRTSRWATIISTPVRVEEHINLLELRAFTLALLWLLSLRRPPSFLRTLFLTDSTVVYFATKKGRSSSQLLSQPLRRVAALLLAGGVAPVLGWVPTHLCPADAPSRSFE